MNKNISIIGSVGVPARYGGFETLAEQLATNLHHQFNITVYCSSKKYNANERATVWNNIHRKFINLHANGAQSILYDLLSLLQCYRTSKVILILGGSAGLFLPLFLPFKKKKTILFHPDGKEWKRLKWKSLSSIYLKLSIQLGCWAADTIILDNKALYNDYHKYKHKITLCTYGGNLGTYKPTTQHKNYWLTIARAEPENNLELIAQAFTATPNEHWYLISNYTDTSFGKKIYSKYKSTANIHFIKSNYSTEQLAQYYNNCKGYIHGHTMGGTNPTLVNAMWLNKPLLCADNAYNRETTKNKAEFFDTEKQLSKLISTRSENNLKLVSDALDIAKKEYTWKNISTQYAKLFNK